MSASTMPEPLETETAAPEHTKSRNKLLATGGLIGALLASTCCVMPLMLLMLGVSGAWISKLTALAPYQPLFLLATFAFLGAGFWQIYRKPRIACLKGGYCASPASERVAKAVLWIATVLVLTTLGINWLGAWFL